MKSELKILMFITVFILASTVFFVWFIRNLGAESAGTEFLGSQKKPQGLELRRQRQVNPLFSRQKNLQPGSSSYPENLPNRETKR